MRSFSKNKVSFCFRPVVDIDSLLESKLAARRSESKPKQYHKKRTVLKVIKAVVLETIFVFQNRRAIHKYPNGLDCFGGLKNDYSTYEKESKASQSSLQTLSSNSSFSSPKVILQSKNMSTEGNHEKESSHGSTLLEKQKKFELYAICLVAISLAFTVFWGKLFGTILTSICLYLIFLLNSNYSCQMVFLKCTRYSVVCSSNKGMDSLHSIYLPVKSRP
ncbi:uncharacterized protein LOC131634134 [Vicia villosa]|uniref:uncharacterized protein LOC131634134 n=1 Tax=Vicia villosa TaxID=3911 RepID=UPI00273A7FED|nr:uncharacterized protein LOC131634134 [Vicia villosa]